jgi:DNA repair protein RadC
MSQPRIEQPDHSAEFFQLPEFHIGLKTKGTPESLITIRNSEDVAAVARKCFDADSIGWVETFIVIALNKANKVMGFYKVSSGGITGTVADPRVIFQFALLSNAVALIVAHNHPSGNLQPSQADETMTRRIKEAGKLLDIKLLDHIIVTETSFYSFADEGNL